VGNEKPFKAGTGEKKIKGKKTIRKKKAQKKLQVNVAEHEFA